MKKLCLAAVCLVLGSTMLLCSQMDTLSNKQKEIRHTKRVTYRTVTESKPIYDRHCKLLFKVNPSAAFTGDFPVYFECKTAENHSVEAGGGITYIDYIREGLIFEEAESYDYGIYTKDDKAIPGYSFRINYKYYPSVLTSSLNEYYIGPEFRFQHYGAEVTDNTQMVYKQERKFMDLKITGGYIYYFGDSFFADIYGGLGVRRRMLNTEDLKDYSIVFAISLGVKIGLGF